MSAALRPSSSTGKNRATPAAISSSRGSIAQLPQLEPLNGSELTEIQGDKRTRCRDPVTEHNDSVDLGALRRSCTLVGSVLDLHSIMVLTFRRRDQEDHSVRVLVNRIQFRRRRLRPGAGIHVGHEDARVARELVHQLVPHRLHRLAVASPGRGALQARAVHSPKEKPIPAETGKHASDDTTEGRFKDVETVLSPL